MTGPCGPGDGLEVVKRSRFVAGKMTERTYEKTRAFMQKVEKKYKCAHHSAPQLHKSTLFEKNVSRKKRLIVGLGAGNGEKDV